jgi:aldehyde:ferredoxin oxidoreductase
VYLSITGEQVELRDARHLWGLGNHRTHELVRQECGKQARIMSIGPGGENRTRIGVIFTDSAGSASMGFGSVMGSKNLKAIAVRGSGRIPVADSATIQDIRATIKRMTGKGFFNLYGTPLTIAGSEVVKYVHCHGCPQGCWRSLQRVPGGFEDIRKCQTNVFYSLWDRKLHGQPTEASFRAATIANDYSLCVMDVAFLLMWLDRCIAAGLLTERDIELPLADMGSREFFEAFCRKICSRQGFGEVLAQGTIRAAEQVGGKALEIARNFLIPTGRAIAYGPKVFILSALIYATEPRPFITELHEVCEPLTKWALWYTSKGAKTYVSTEVVRNIAKRFWGSEQAADFTTYDGKAQASLLIQNRAYAKESLILCDFAWPLYDDASTQDHVGDPTMESRLLSAVTGRDIDSRELNHIAERIFTLNRAILLREGRQGRQDDTLPEFFFIDRDEFIGDVFGMHNPQLFLPGPGEVVISRRGKGVDRQQFEGLKDEYYGLRGWDVGTGLLKKETLRGLDLQEVVDPLGDKVV